MANKTTPEVLPDPAPIPTPEVLPTPEVTKKKKKAINPAKLITEARDAISDSNPFKQSLINTLDEVLEKL